MGEIYGTMGPESTALFGSLESFLRDSYDLNTELRFPFGNTYGWGNKYSHKSKHLCYVFFEKGAFTVTIQIGKAELPKVYEALGGLLPKTKRLWENRYPCGEGGWLHYRVLNIAELEDVEKLIMVKKSPVRK